MNKIFKYGLLLLGASLLAACQPEVLRPDQSRLPVASELTADIQVDQTTNIVTFSILDKGVVPVWIFGEELIDGKPSKKYSYAQNGIQLRIREAGTHSVELRAYNSNGLSQGSQTVQFTLENTYRDPFDPTPYMKAMANSWVWDQANKGHFGCGENVDNPTGWWSCDPDGKAGVGLYDDVMTFTAEGQYTYNPGEGGTVYANKDVTALGGSVHEEDYEIPIEEFTCNYSIENNWNEAGIEEIYLVLPEGKNLSYVPNDEAVTTNTRYLFVSTKASDIKKNLKLVNYSPTANGGGSIAWMYSFVPFVKTATPEELLAGTGAEGKAWVMDAATTGHLACGPSFEDPTSWWAAAPNEKAGFGMYDNVLVFYPDGKYIFDSGEDGQIYANKDVTLVEGGPQGADFLVDWPDQESSYTFDGETLTLPEGVVIGYVPNDGSFSNPVFQVTKITETSLVLVSVGDGISWQYIFKARDIEAPAQTIGGVAVEGGKADLSLTQGGDIAVSGIDLSGMWIDPDYFAKKDDNTLTFLALDGDYRIMVLENWLKVIPMSGDAAATYDDGKAIWVIGDGYGKPEGGNVGWVTGEAVDLPLARISENEYQITLYYNAPASNNPSFKLFGQANWGKEFVSTDYESIEGNGLFAIGTGSDGHDNGNIYSLTNEPGWYVFKVKDNDGALSITMDKKRETFFDISGETNLWRSASVTPEYWYSAADWSGGIAADAELGENNSFSANIPDGVGGAEWQAQNKLKSNIAIEAGQAYDFCCTIEASAEMTITVKLAAMPGDDKEENQLYYNNSVTLGEYSPLTLKLENLSVAAPTGTELMLIFDFGRSPAGSHIDVTDICFQKHLER